MRAPGAAPISSPNTWLIEPFHEKAESRRADSPANWVLMALVRSDWIGKRSVLTSMASTRALSLTLIRSNWSPGDTPDAEPWSGHHWGETSPRRLPNVQPAAWHHL